MAQKLSVQIELEGGREIAKQLDELGAAGKKAFTEIGRAAEQVGGFDQLDPTAITQKLEEMGITGAEAIDKIQGAVEQAGRLEQLVQGVRSLENGFGALSKVLRPLGSQFRQIEQAGAAVYKVLGPIGVAGAAAFAAIGTAIAVTTKLTIGFAESINKVSDEAIKVGLSIEKFDQLRASLEAAGISGKGISEILQRMGQAADAADLSKVTQAIKELQEASERGFGAVGTTQLQTLEAAAKGVGPAADAARKALVELGLVKVDPQGVAIIEGLPQTLAQLVGSTGSAEKGLAAFIEQLRQMPPGAQQSKLAVQELGSAAGEIVRAFQTGQITADQFKQQLSNLITPQQAANAAELGQSINRLEAAWTRFGSVTFAPLITAQINTITQALQSLQLAVNNFSWETFKNGAVSVGSALGWLTPAGLAAKGLGAAFGEAAPAIAQTGTAATQAGQTAAAGFKPWVDVLGSVATQSQTAGAAAAAAGQQGAQAGQTAASGWDVFLQKLRDIAAAAGRILGGGGGGAPAVPGMAGGGLLGGRGTGTSDSNLAWISRGEYIMPAGAVRKPGVLSFLEAMRRSGGNLSRVLDGMGRFALGGMVPRAIPTFAAGGLAGGGNHVTIQFPGLPPISGLRASSDVVDQLHKAAALAQVRSGGRKPSRYS